MRGRPYYEEPDFHLYLLSRERRELFPRQALLAQIQWQGGDETSVSDGTVPENGIETAGGRVDKTIIQFKRHFYAGVGLQEI